MAQPSQQRSWHSMLRILKSLARQDEAKNHRTGLRCFSKTSKFSHQALNPTGRGGSQRKGEGYPLLIIPLTCVGLGTWQIQRREWKLNLIKELEIKMYATPTELPLNLEDLADMEYHKVKVRGSFDHSRELFIGPRSNVQDRETTGFQGSQSLGVNVVTPFKLSDRDKTILVNRGHVPFKMQEAQLRKEGQREGEVELVGVVRISDKKPIANKDGKESEYWLTRNVEEMAQVAGTESVFLDADINSSVPGGPMGGQTRVTLRNDHLSYIITWYSLAALTFFLWYKNYRGASRSTAALDYMEKTRRKKM